MLSQIIQKTIINKSIYVNFKENSKKMQLASYLATPNFESTRTAFVLFVIAKTVLYMLCIYICKHK
jgi:hypothetical protein